MRISIVTISYNQKKFLEQCIKSVAAQKGDWEHIIVDPGSTDGSRELIRAHADHFSKIVFDRDEGPADGLNRGFAKATGDIGYFLNSDDFLLAGAVEYMSDVWTKHCNDMDVLLCGAWKIDSAGSAIDLLLPTLPTARSFQQGRTAIVQQGMSFRMALFNAVGGFNLNNTTCWDGELVAKFVSSHARFRISHRRLAAFRIHEDSISGGVGGEALAQRYVEDTNRIRQENFPDDTVVRGAESGFVSKVFYRLRHPRRSLKLAVCRLLPAIMGAKWSAERRLR